MGGGERKKHCSIAMKEFEENLGKGITLTPQQGNSFLIFFFFFFFFLWKHPHLLTRPVKNTASALSFGI